MASALKVIQFRSNKQLEVMNSRSLQAEQNEPLILSLASHVRRCWEAARNAKMPIEQQMLRNLRQRNGEYEPDKLAEIREMGGSEIFMMITSSKCRSAEAWLRDIMLPATDRAWELSPTPMPDLPGVVKDAIINQVYQEGMAAGWQIDDNALDERMNHLRKEAMLRLRDVAEEIAERHEQKIDDQLAEGGWENALVDFLYDFVTMKAGIIKAPVFRNRNARKWAPMSNGQWTPVVQKQVRMEFERRSPFDIYPAPGMRDINSNYLIDRYRFSREDLESLIGVTGYSEDAIKAALESYGSKGTSAWLWGDQTRATLEQRGLERLDPMQPIEALNYWGSVSGSMLNEWEGGNKYDPHAEYQVDAWQVGIYTIKAVLNPDVLGRKPYFKACFEDIPGSFWGFGLPEILADAQAMCNASARALANNMAFASGPQGEVNVDRLADGEKVTGMRPWRMWQTLSDLAGGNREAVRFFQPNSNAQELMLIYEEFSKIADNVSGIPSYVQGSGQTTGGAGRTASGLSMLMGNASKGIKRVVTNIDRQVVEPVIERIYDWNMEHDPDTTIKGDLRAVAKASSALMQKEQMQIRRAELLQATMNPIDAQIMGTDGRAELLRESIKAAELPVDKIIPDKLALELKMGNAPPPWVMAGGGGGGTGQPGIPGSNLSPPGGSPAAPQTLDAAGAPAQGTDTAVAQPRAFADGGPVRARKFMIEKLPDGRVLMQDSE